MAGLEDLYREIILDHYRSERAAFPRAHHFEGDAKGFVHVGLVVVRHGAHGQFMSRK